MRADFWFISPLSRTLVQIHLHETLDLQILIDGWVIHYIHQPGVRRGSGCTANQGSPAEHSFASKTSLSVHF